jgi:uncharacterized protein YbjT (DUF2867 family)
MPSPARILVLGATGYVGRRLVPRLLAAGHTVRCLVRDPRKLEGRGWTGVEVLRGDVLNPASLAAAEGCSILYYLVHSMTAGETAFEEQDRAAAANTAGAAAAAGMDRIIYLGGLGDTGGHLSPHLRSRNDVGRVLASGSVPVTEFRAAMIIGSGSASFEMLHALVNRLPVMTAPRWVSTRSQPVAIRDVLRYLVDALDVPASAGRVLDIGGPDILTYRELMLRFARILGLRRRIIVVPVLTPRLSSAWVHLVTPVSATIARPLIEGLRSEMICTNHDARSLFPFEPLGFEDAARLALRRMQDPPVESRWTDAGLSAAADPQDHDEEGQLLKDVRRLTVRAPAESLFRSFASIGGENGWYFADLLWRARGAIDRAIGGVGLRRGRRHPVELLPGDTLDFWRVDEVEPGRRILLRAEMKVPGRAWLEFTAEPRSDGASTLIQTARFYPRGLSGLLYWYAVYPLHGLVFNGMASAVRKRAEQTGR